MLRRVRIRNSKTVVDIITFSLQLHVSQFLGIKVLHAALAVDEINIRTCAVNQKHGKNFPTDLQNSFTGTLRYAFKVRGDL